MEYGERDVWDAMQHCSLERRIEFIKRRMKVDTKLPKYPPAAFYFDLLTRYVGDPMEISQRVRGEPGQEMLPTSEALQLERQYTTLESTRTITSYTRIEEEPGRAQGTVACLTL